MKIRIFEAFAGYGSQAMAAKRLQRDFPDDVQFEFVGISEIDPSAIKAYQAVHGPTTNYGDISKIDWEKVPDFDLFTYSFPCQDISMAGKQRGLAKGSGTRSALLWECEKAIAAKRPRFLLMENVKKLVQKKFMPDLQRWIDLLDSYGYCSRWQVLNAKDYGVAQNRERVFMVSTLRDEPPYVGQYRFPDGIQLDKCVEDYLQPGEEVGPAYYIKPERVPESALADIAKGKKAQPGRICQVANIMPGPPSFRNRQSGRAYSTKGISPCITAALGGPILVLDDGRLRRMTERETLRVMGVSDVDIDKMLSAVSRHQAYKLAGNSIVVSCLYRILKQLFIQDSTKQLLLFSDLQNLK